MQATDSSERKQNFVQGIKMNLCQHPDSSAFKLVQRPSLTSQNQGLGYQKNLANDAFKNLIQPNLQIQNSKIFEEKAKNSEEMTPVQFQKQLSKTL